MHIIFETPRMLLRQFTEQDAHLIKDLNSDPAVVKYLHEPLLKTNEHALQVITDIILPQYKNKLGRWAMHLKSNNEFIGWCGLKYNAASNEIDLGYRLRQIFWGKGYATEAAKATLAYGFNTLHLKQITGTAHVENLASIKILEKIGMVFQKEGVEDGCVVKVYLMDKSPE